MRNRNQLIFGSIIVLFGILLLIGNVFHIDIGALCWPIGLILLGAWLLLRPKIAPSGAPVTFILLGDARRRGAWKVAPEEFWTGICDVDLDFTQAEIPPGETAFRLYGFIGDIKVEAPAGVGISISSMAFITNAKFLGKHQESFFNPVALSTEGYESAERKIHLETLSFISDIKVR